MPCSKAIVQVAGGTGGEGGGGIGDGGGGDPPPAHDCPPPLLPPPPRPPLLPPPLLPPLLWLWLPPPVLGPPKRRRPCFLLWLFVRFFPLDDLLLCLLRLLSLRCAWAPDEYAVQTQTRPSVQSPFVVHASKWASAPRGSCSSKKQRLSSRWMPICCMPV